MTAPTAIPTLDRAGAERLLREVAAENPGHIHDDCRYLTDDREPNCIVGHVLRRAGWSVEALDVADHHLDDGMPLSCAARDLPDLPAFAGLTAAAAKLLADAQVFQDTKHTWAESVEIALSPVRVP